MEFRKEVKQSCSPAISLTSFHPLTMDFLSGSCVPCPGRFSPSGCWAAGCLSLPGTQGLGDHLGRYGLPWSTEVGLPVVSCSQQGPHLQVLKQWRSHAGTAGLINHYRKPKSSSSGAHPSAQSQSRVVVTVTAGRVSLRFSEVHFLHSCSHVASCSSGCLFLKLSLSQNTSILVIIINSRDHGHCTRVVCACVPSRVYTCVCVCASASFSCAASLSGRTSQVKGAACGRETEEDLSLTSHLARRWGPLWRQRCPLWAACLFSSVPALSVLSLIPLPRLPWRAGPSPRGFRSAGSDPNSVIPAFVTQWRAGDGTGTRVKHVTPRLARGGPTCAGPSAPSPRPSAGACRLSL